MSRAVVSLSLSCALVLVAATHARAAGLPVPLDGFETTSVVKPDGNGPRYATVNVGDRTALMEIQQDGGEITATRMIRGAYSVPLVAFDGTSAGLAADGSILALISSRTGARFPRARTSFVMVDLRANRPLRPRAPLTLRGDFSFDAFSPDGHTMYLTEYLSRDYNNYAVREYDLRRERLLPDPVLVAHEVEPGEMRGLPMTRATSPDGRWEYTLYNRGGGRRDEAFIHTLDTERGISHCVDLPMVNGEEAWRVGLDLSEDGRTLSATRGGQTLAMLDTETFALTEPLAPELTDTPESGGGPGALTIGLLGMVTALAVGAGLWLRRYRVAI